MVGVLPRVRVRIANYARDGAKTHVELHVK
jgi:hypothetical protein